VQAATVHLRMPRSAIVIRGAGEQAAGTTEDGRRQHASTDSALVGALGAVQAGAAQGVGIHGALNSNALSQCGGDGVAMGDRGWRIWRQRCCALGFGSSAPGVPVPH
jgi:hypothetical protein